VSGDGPLQKPDMVLVCISLLLIAPHLSPSDYGDHPLGIS